MSDLEIDDELDVFVDSTGDLGFATGRDAFEQQITISLIDYYHNNTIGEDDPQTAIESIKIGARRAVERVDELDRVAEINTEFSDEEPNTMLVDIIFDTGEQLTFTL